jgi:hypothetical protein
MIDWLRIACQWILSMNVTGRCSAKRSTSVLRQKHCLTGLVISIFLASVLLIHLFSNTFARLHLSYTQQASISDTKLKLDRFLCDNTTDHACEKITCAVILRAQNGRLGNRMFMFASAYGLARAHQCRLHVSDAMSLEWRASLSSILSVRFSLTWCNRTHSVIWRLQAFGSPICILTATETMCNEYSAANMRHWSD